MSKHVVNSNSSHHENAARVKRPAGRVAISLVLVLGTVFVSSSSSPHMARASLASNGLVFGPFQGSGESWEVTGCATVCADPVIIPSVVDGKPVLGIGGSSFWFDYSLREVQIPASITTISGYAFGGSSATNFVVDPASDHFKSVGGTLLTKDGTELVAYPGGAVATSVTVPAGVRKLRMGSFYSGPATSVSLPASLEEIEQQVFGLNGLTTIEIPISVSIIGEDAFGPAMTAISVAAGNPTFRATEGVLFRGNELFAYPRGRTATTYQIPAGTTAIQSTALDRNSVLASIALPVSLTTLSSNPLRGLSALSSVTVEAGHQTLSAIDGVLFGGGALIAYPKAKAGATYSVPAGTTAIGNSAFIGVSALTTITLPDSITVIGSEAFAYNPNLETVDLPSELTTLGTYALYYTKVTNVVVPHTVTDWGWQVFGYNQNIPTSDFHLYFEGDAPPAGSDIGQNNGAIIHRIEGTTGWPAFAEPYLGYAQVPWSPNISTPRAPSGVALAESVRVTARRGNGGLPSSYLVEASPGNATCTIVLPDVSCVVTGLTAGTAYTFTTKATKAQTNTASSPASAIIRPLAAHTISFTRPVDRAFSSTPFVVTATSDANLPVVLASSTLDVCTVSSLEVTMLTTGTCTLSANAAGNSSYSDAYEIIRSFTISEAEAPTTPSTVPTESPTPSPTTTTVDNVEPGVVNLPVTGNDSKPLAFYACVIVVGLCLISAGRRRRVRID